MLGKCIVAFVVLSATAMATETSRVFVKSCGNARPDLEVCLLWNVPSNRGTVDLVFAKSQRESFDVVADRADRRGVQWFVGTGRLRGAPVYYWLRVDDSGGELPVTPRPPRTAALFYRTSVNQKWQAYPASTHFLFAEVAP